MMNVLYHYNTLENVNYNAVLSSKVISTYTLIYGSITVPVVASSTAAYTACNLPIIIKVTSQSEKVGNTVSFLPGEALGSISRRNVSHRKCQGIMCDQHDLSVEGHQLSSPAERHGLFQRDQSRRPALTRLLAVQGGENVTVTLHLQCKLSAP